MVSPSLYRRAVRVLAVAAVTLATAACADSGAAMVDAGSAPPDARAAGVTVRDASGACVAISIGASALACRRTADCRTAPTGPVCASTCDYCPNTAVNATAAAAIEGASPSGPSEVCYCPDTPIPTCVFADAGSDASGTCTFCLGVGNPAGCPSGS